MTQMSKQEFDNRTFQQLKPDPEKDTGVPLWVAGILVLLAAIFYLVATSGVVR